MIDDLRPYPAMKDSGVPWLGEVPAHWQCNAFRATATARKGRQPRTLSGPGSGKESLPYLSMHFLRSMKASASEFATLQSDLVIAEARQTILLWDGANAGEFLKSKPGVVSSTCALIVPHAANPEFFYYACKIVEPTLRALTVGMGIPHVDGDILKGLRLPVPTLSEQAAIVCFLGHAERLIRRYIHAKQKVIRLLEEQKQAVIQHAVTRAGDPNGRMKPSRVKWLGDIPKHWQVRRIASFSPKITNGWVGPTRDILHDSGVPYIQSLHVKHGVIKFDKKYFVSAEWLDAREKIRLRQGDVVVVQTGDIGQVACIPPAFDGAGCHALIIIRTDTRVMTGRFLDLVLRSRYGYESLKSVQTGALHPHLNCTWVREIFVPVPPVEEQEKILLAVEKATASVDKGITRADQELDLVREFRTRLIADVVTGKLDVRETASRLPAALEEPGPLDEVGAITDEEAAAVNDVDEPVEETIE